MAAPVFDAASSAVGASSTGSDTSVTWSHTVGAGSNRLLVVLLSDNPTDAVSSVTYGGVALTQLPGAHVVGGTGAEVDIWYLKNPASGAANFVATWAAQGYLNAGAVSFSGVDQTTPLDTPVTATGTGRSASATVATDANNIVIDNLCLQESSADNPTATAGGSQTQRFNEVNLAGGPRSASSTQPGAASVAMQWAFTGAVQWALAAVAVKGASGVAAVPRAYAGFL